MPLYTTYLGFLNSKHAKKMYGGRWYRTRTAFSSYALISQAANGGDKVTDVLFVMRNRGNNAIEPPEMVLRLLKEKAITWEGYRAAYLDSLKTVEAQEWMKRVADHAKNHDIVLVCYEKDAEHCHRTLLANEIAERFGVAYLGELDGKEA